METIRIGVRPAEKDDLDVLLAMHDSADAAIRDERGGDLDIATHWDTAMSSRRAWYEAQIDGSTPVCVGTIDDVVVGCIVVDRLSTTLGDVARVQHLWVEPAMRGVGVGASLMRHAVVFAKDEGCVGIDARALPGDRNTKNFFESFGLVARSLVVHQRFDA